MVKYCPECGKKVKPTDKYCKECGAAIAESAKVWGKEPEPERPPAEAPQKSPLVTRNKVMTKAGIAWVSCLAGLFFLPPAFWTVAILFGYSALDQATNMGLSKTDVLICGIPALIGVGLLVWWGIGIINLL